MKQTLVAVTLLALLTSLAPAAAGQVDVGISVGPGGVKGFYLSVGSYFHVPEAEVVAVRNRYRIADEELPVVFFLAARARVAPAVIIDLRLGGIRWFDIALRYRLVPDIFFVPVAAWPIGPPYGKAYGYYRRYKEHGKWGGVILTDREVLDLVNLRFASEYHKVVPETVMGMRGKGHAFVAIHDEVAKEKGKSAKGVEGHSGKGKDKETKRK